MSKTINLSKPLALDKATFCQVFLEPVFNQDPRLSTRELKERESLGWRFIHLVSRRN